jgi:tripeptidyl-peptidase-1
VARHVDFVAPTVHFPAVRTQRVRIPEAGDFLNTPPVLAQLYQVPNGTANVSPNNLQGFASFLQQYWAPSDLQEFFKLFLNQSVGQSPAQSFGPNDPSQTGTEAELDVQYIMGMGVGVPTWAYYTPGTAPNPNNEPFLAWLLFLAQQSTIPAVLSVSYGEDEKSVGLDYGGRVNAEFQKVGLRGTSIMFAAGDDGAGGNCSSSGRFTPDFPSGSPWVTAVGGTTGGNPGSVPTGETADGISGGGFSDYWPQPAWQSDAVAYYLKNAPALPGQQYFNATGRGYPDVAAQSEGFVVVQDGFPLPGVGGTSCASPTFSGIIALLNDLRIQQGKSTLGFLNPLLYKIAPANVNSFNDVTSGTNEGCNGDGFTAYNNWDPVTGWGSPNYSMLKPIVQALP